MVADKIDRDDSQGVMPGNEVECEKASVAITVSPQDMMGDEENIEIVSQENPVENKCKNKETIPECWKRVAKKGYHANVAVGKVNLENKIGTLACNLNEDDPLKVIGLSLQRAMRDFGRVGTTCATEGDMSSPDNVTFSAVGTNATTADEGNSSALESNVSPSNQQYTVHQPKFQCRKICDKEFAKVRTQFGITERQYYSVFGLQTNRTESNLYALGSGDAGGKSKSFFFLSPDQRYIFKSCTEKDVKMLCRILPQYKDYIGSTCSQSDKGEDTSTESKNHPSLPESDQAFTFLPRYLGLYSLQFENDGNPAKVIPSVVVVAMTNFFAGANTIHRKFDLKGSTYGRSASERERQKKTPVYKDLDWIGEGRELRFSNEGQMKKMRMQLYRDTLFLRRCNLIDYSLLVGVHEMDQALLENYQNYEPMDVFNTRCGNDTISYFGIVDILTPYGLRKGGETLLLGKLICRDISCQTPGAYQKRFMDFCDYAVLSCSKDGENREDGN